MRLDLSPLTSIPNLKHSQKNADTIVAKMGWVRDIHEMEGAGYEITKPETSEKVWYNKMHWTYKPGFAALQYI
jgi:hypothetical protein